MIRIFQTIKSTPNPATGTIGRSANGNPLFEHRQIGRVAHSELRFSGEGSAVFLRKLDLLLTVLISLSQQKIVDLCVSDNRQPACALSKPQLRGFYVSSVKCSSPENSESRSET